MLRELLSIWIANQGIEVLSAVPDGWREKYPELYREIFQALAIRLPVATLPHILALPPSELRPSLMGNIAYGLEAEKMSIFSRAIADLTDSEQRQFAELDSISVANKAPGQLLAWSKTLSEQQNSIAAQSAIQALARIDPIEALTLANDLPRENRNQVIRSTLRKLAESDPLLAAAEAERQGRHFAEVARVWATNEPVAAIKWLMEHTPAARNSSHDPLMDMASSWGGRDVDAALAFTEELPEGIRARWTTSIAGRLAYSDPELLETLAQTYADTPYATDLYTRLAHRRYRADPQGTLDLLLNLKPEIRDKPLASLVRLALENHPEKAVSVLDKITSQDLRIGALSSVLDRWSDAGAMEQWLANDASSLLRDEAYAILAADQPSLLTSIKNRGLRVATHLRSEYGTYSRAGMVSMLQELGLSDAQWTRLDNAVARAANEADSS